MATPKLKIIVRLNEPHSPYGDVHRRRITEASPGAARACSALTHPNHAEPEIAHQRPHDGPGMRFRDFSPPATTTRSTPRPNFSVPHPVMIGLPRDRRLPRTGTGPAGAPVRGAKVGTRRHLAVRRSEGGALSQVVVPGWIETADEVSASLPSLARREARRASLGHR